MVLDHKYPLKLLNVLENFESIGFDEESNLNDYISGYKYLYVSSALFWISGQ